LHEMLDIPEKMIKLVNDYKLFLVEARKNELKLHNINNRDLFNLLEIILSRTDTTVCKKEKAIQYSQEHNTDKDVIMTVTCAANITLELSRIGKGDGKMCTMFEEILKEGEEIGEARGRAIEIIETGIEFGMSESDILDRLQKKLNISLQAAQEYFATYGK